MNKIVLLVLAGFILVSAQSCSSVAKFNNAKKDLENETAKPSSIIVNATGKKAEADAKQATEADEEAEVTAEEAENVTQIAGLVPATNPEFRVRGNVRGRQDPFSVITVQPELIVEEEEVKENQSNLPQRRTARNTKRVNVDASNTNSEPVFEPVLAQNVVISGLIEVDGRPKLIVQAPEETSSRYVEVGQYLSNGQILVKSIDMNHFPTPLVILEQSGVEVAKAIGESTDESSTISSSDSIPLAALTQ